MSNIQKGLRTYLLSKPNVRSRCDSRIVYDRLLGTQQVPAIVINEFSSDHEYILTGAAGVYESRVLIDCMSGDRIKCDELSDIVRVHLQGYTGTAGSETIQSSQLDGRSRDTVEHKKCKDDLAYRTRMTFNIVVTESIPTF